MPTVTPRSCRQLARRAVLRLITTPARLSRRGAVGPVGDRCLSLCALLTGLWCAARFVALGVSPPGFFVDEALGALHLQCLLQTGRSAHGVSWPWFAQGLDGGFYTPPFLYTGLAWARMFGTSVVSMRSFAAAYSLATIVGLWLLARELSDARTARLVALAAALSPWSFQFARLAWDPPIAPALAVWGTFLFFRSERVVWRAGAGALLSLAMYSYPPQRVQVPLFVLLLVAGSRGRAQPRGVFAFVAAFTLSSVPLALRSLDPRFAARSAALSIAAPSYLADHGGEHPLRFLFRRLLDNLYLHLRPDFLFFSGDASLRHSSQIMGQLGWLDDLACCALVALLLRPHLAGREPPVPVETGAVRYSRAKLALAAAGCFGLGVLPAALTHQGLPHALRAIGAWPALAFLSGVCLSAAWPRAAWVPKLIVVVALAQSAYFLPRYFLDYPQRADDAFQASVRRAAERHDLVQLGATARRRGELLVRYYLGQELGYSCDEARAAVAAVPRLRHAAAAP